MGENKKITTMKIYNFNRETESGIKKYVAMMKTDSPLFKTIEDEFDKFMEANGDKNDLGLMYFSEDAIYDKKWAIRGAIDQIFEVMDEYDLKFIFLNDKRLDLISVFAD